MERATQERLVGATLLIVAGVIMIPWLLDGNNTDRNVTERELVLPGGSDSGNETRRISLEIPRAENGQSESAVREIDARTVRDVDQPAAAMTLPAPKPAAKPAAEGTVPSRFAKPMPESTEPSKATSSRPVVVASPDPAPVRNEVASLAKPPVRTDVEKPAAEKPPVIVAKPKPKPQAAPPRVEPKPVVPVSTASAGKAWAVQVGSFASQENAERLTELLRGKSYKAFVMRNVIEGRVRYRVRVGPVDERNEADLLATALREDRQPARVLAHP